MMMNITWAYLKRFIANDDRCNKDYNEDNNEDDNKIFIYKYYLMDPFNLCCNVSYIN
jgi:hypothetical protein